MRADEFQYLCQLLKSRSGLVLTEDKSYLIESRLMPIARKHAMKGLEELVEALRSGKNGNLAIEVTEAMTTNESFFFRDIKPFDLFRDIVIPNLLESKTTSKTMRIWSAACSSGQEAYSLAMVLDEMQPKISGWNIEIVATDISTDMLNKAKAGVYSQFEVQRGLPIQYLVKNFEQKGEKWYIHPNMKRNIVFKYFNLLDNPAPLGMFDVVFCRNVLIYFDQETKTLLLDRIANILSPNGYLFLGGAETVLGITNKFQPVPEHRGLYVPAVAATAKSATA